MASSGHNGKNESFIGFSYGISLSFLDQYGNEITVKNAIQPIQMYIPRDPSLYNNEYLLVNVSSNLNISNDSQILPNAIFIYATNASIHIQIQPNNTNIGYLILLKFDSSPILTSTKMSYDFWTLLCPNSTDYYQVNDTCSSVLDSYYLFFLNMAQVYKFLFYDFV